MSRDNIKRDNKRAKLSNDKAHLKNRVLGKYVLVVDARESQSKLLHTSTCAQTAHRSKSSQMQNIPDRGSAVRHVSRHKIVGPQQGHGLQRGHPEPGDS